MHVWLDEIKDEFKDLNTLQEIANLLREKVQAQWNLEQSETITPGLIIHLAGFELSEGFWIPQVWHIANTDGLGKFGYLNFKKEFYCVDAFHNEFKDIHPKEIRPLLKVMAKRFEPFWFHQGFDFVTFNVMQSAMKSSFRFLCENHPGHESPKGLSDWMNHVRMQILVYGAFFEAFRNEGERFVGGGADVQSLPWPKLTY